LSGLGLAPICQRPRWRGIGGSVRVLFQFGVRVQVMSESGLKNLSLFLLVALAAYVAWSGGN
jgi:hypothetical protein